MLILTRKKDETMVVGHEVRVKVLAVSGNQIKIGIDAPREVSIMRDELVNPPTGGGVVDPPETEVPSGD